MPDQTIVVGRSIEDMVENLSGGVESRLIALHDLGSAAYTVAEEFAYDEYPEAVALVALAREMETMLDRLSVAPDGIVTLLRECGRCSGAGKSGGEDPCVDCRGHGYLPAPAWTKERS